MRLGSIISLSCIGVLALCLNLHSYSQNCPGCDVVVSYDVDLSANPDSVWITPTEIGRSGQCCQGYGSQRCIRFNVITHPDAKKLMFTLASPPIPTSKQYSLNCGTSQSVNSPLCINGTGPHCIVYCKEGADILKYKIVSERDAKAGPDIAVGNGCSGIISASGFDKPSIEWNVVYPSSIYNSYLSCRTGCDSVTVTAQPGYPEYVDVEVSGSIGQSCGGSPTKKDTVRVYFIDDKTLEILPKDPTICYGGASVQLTANPTGGAEPLSYLWNTGETTKSIDVSSPGDYSVMVFDSTECPPIYDTITVKQHLSPITADAGDGTVCTETPQVILNGHVTEAEGGIWSGGAGTFTPDNETLNAIYTLSPTEVTNLGTTLTLTTTGNGGCPPSSDQMQIIVSPKPIVDAGNDGIVCQTALSVQLGGTIVGSSTDGVWSSLGTGLFSNPQDLNATYYPSQSDTAAGQVQLVLSSIANGTCSPVRDTVTIQFGNLPATNFAFSQPACAGEPIHFNDHTVVTWGVVTNYEWDFAGYSTSTDRNPSTSFPTPGTYSVTLKTTTDKGCENTITKDVLVSEDPTADFTYTKVCYGSGVSFQNASIDASTYIWDFKNGFVSTLTDPTGIIYTEEGIYDVILTAIDANGCRDSVIKPVELFPRPLADYMVDNICSGTDVTFSDNSTIASGNIISWKWDFGDGTTSTDQNPTQTFSTSVPLNVKLTVSSGLCSDSIVRQVTPLKEPSFFASPTSGCAPLTVDFFNSVQPNVYYTWDFGDGNTSSLPNAKNMFLNETANPVDYEVTLYAKSIFGCEDSVKSIVSTYPQSKSKFTVSDKSVCSGETVSFTNISENAVSYSWDFGDLGADADMNPVKTMVNSTDQSTFIKVQLFTRSMYNCSDTAVEFVTINPIPSTEINQDKLEDCHPAFISFTAPTGSASYRWDFGDGTIDIGSNEMQHTFTNESTVDKTYSINLEVESVQGCKATGSASVVVHPSPLAKFTLDKSAGCAPLKVQILNTSKDAISYNWTYGDGQMGFGSDLVQEHIYGNTDNVQKSYELNLTVTSNNGCTNSYSESVTVYPEVHADFNIPITEGCAPFFAEFENLSSGADSYRWEFGDGDFSTNKDAKHAYLNSTTSRQQHQVLLIAASALGCTDSSNLKSIYVNPKPITDFEISDAAGCSPFNIGITNNTTGAHSYNWEATNGFTSNTDITSLEISNSTSIAEKHTITLSASNVFGCEATSIQTVTIYPEVQAIFDPIAEGCGPLPVQFLNSSINSLSYEWDFGDGSTATISEPEYEFNNSSTQTVVYTVTLTAHSDLGCSNSTTKDITVYATPDADFELNESYLEYPKTTAIFQNKTIGDWDVYEWDFGDGTTSADKNPYTHTYRSEGIFKISLKVKGQLCEDTISHTVVVKSPGIIVDYDQSYEGCAPLEAQFYNKSENAEWYEWDFGDGSPTSQEVNPSHTYTKAGTYIVELTAFSLTQQASSRKHTVVVYPVPEVDFSVAPELVYLPNSEVTFYNQTENGDSYIWHFGDDAKSTEYETTHYYQEEGVYTVTLYTTTEHGCKDTLVKPRAVTVKLKCDMVLPNAFTPAETEIPGNWNPEMPEVTNDIFHPVFDNIEEFNMQIFNRWGELIYESNDILIGWNGYYKGTICKQDTYVYQIKASCYGGQKITKKGSVALVR